MQFSMFSRNLRLLLSFGTNCSSPIDFLQTIAPFFANFALSLFRACSPQRVNSFFSLKIKKNLTLCHP